ncbi:DUF397 domain-containing protein [Streptomyces sp. SID12501]|uniref:DUF397 domain-containing protein n=1 Tax=Streptomyces sp. SID12501 TaxID=2706042 RepID=A0A6B3C3N6_9ACTN|nr:DUF397 domain-containing protein [Streptomyces sp. SID12501]NEC90860.1 DUF397 domain-containing protein [Streptomyces sp. SID12501]
MGNWRKSSYSGPDDGNNCVEIAIPETWRKSSHSGGGDGNECVELANAPTHTAIRDSKAPTTRTLTFPASAYTPFIDSLKSPTRQADSGL